MRRARARPSMDPEFACVPLRIGRSNVHGFGVFAEADLPRGARIIEYTGELVTMGEAKARYFRDWCLCN